jgi:hypothetical protein
MEGLEHGVVGLLGRDRRLLVLGQYLLVLGWPVGGRA